MILKIIPVIIMSTSAFSYEYGSPYYRGLADPEWQCGNVDTLMDSVEKAKRFSHDDLLLIYKEYQFDRHCDDGYYGEGFSDMVAKILVKDFARSIELMERDSGLRTFVERHVDATCDSRDLRQILANTEQRCAESYKTTCLEIRDVILRPEPPDTYLRTYILNAGKVEGWPPL